MQRRKSVWRAEEGKEGKERTMLELKLVQMRGGVLYPINVFGGKKFSDQSPVTTTCSSHPSASPSWSGCLTVTQVANSDIRTHQLE